MTDIIGTPELTNEEWEALKSRVKKGGAIIIKLSGRSSFQSPSYVSVEMMRAAMGGDSFRWPSGCYVNTGDYNHIMMAMETSITKDGVTYAPVKGIEEEVQSLTDSYNHLVKLRDEVIEMGILPAVDQWHTVNENL